MNLHSDIRSGRRQQVPEAVQQNPHYVGAVVFLEIILATALVCGLFAAACTPFGWSGVLQFLLCTLLGGLLWFIDDKLDGVMKSGAPRAIARVNPQDQLPEDHVIPDVVEKLEAQGVSPGDRRNAPVKPQRGAIRGRGIHLANKGISPRWG